MSTILIYILMWFLSTIALYYVLEQEYPDYDDGTMYFSTAISIVWFIVLPALLVYLAARTIMITLKTKRKKT